MYVTTSIESYAKRDVARLKSMTAKQAKTRLKAGANVYFEGDNAEWLYQVTSGVLRLTRVLENGRRQVIAFGYPGDIVGFPSGGRHNADCDVLVDAELQPFRRTSLEFGANDPMLHLELLQAALHEINSMHDHLMVLGLKSALGKVASFISVLADRVGEPVGQRTQVKLPMSRSDIGDFLGLSTETVCRTLTQLRKRGVIAMDNTHTVTVMRQTDLLQMSLDNRSN